MNGICKSQKGMAWLFPVEYPVANSASKSEDLGKTEKNANRITLV